MFPITEFFNLVLTHNRGVSFGLFSSESPESRWILIGLTMMISLILTWWLTTAKTKISVLSYGLMIGGAVGNIADRFIVGAVIDFLDFHVYGFHWPAFNIADAAICLGAGSLIFESFFPKKNLHPNQKI